MTRKTDVFTRPFSGFPKEGASRRADSHRQRGAVRIAVATVLAITMLGTVLLSSPARPKVFFDPEEMDFTVRPGEDFFRYANGGWLDRTEIPPDKPSLSLKEIMFDKRERAILNLIENIGRLESVEEGSPEQIIRDLYDTGLDFEKIDAESAGPLAGQLALIADMSTLSDVPKVVGRLHSAGFDPLFSIAVRQDLKENDVFKLHLLQGGLGLPDREYYLAESDRAKAIRAEYVKHVTRMFELLGDAPGEADTGAKAVLEIETRLARKSLTRLEKRNLAACHHPLGPAELEDLCPEFDWRLYFENLSEIDFGIVVVDAPAFYEEMGRMLDDVPLVDWKAYLRWDLVDEFAMFLGGDLAEQNHCFFAEFLSGSTQRVDRRTLLLETISMGLGEVVGRLYVKEYFRPEAKEKMLELTGRLKKAFASRIRNLDWLGEATKQEALAKLEAMRVKVGYPDKWKDFSRLTIKRDSFVSNLLRLSRFLRAQQLARFGKPVDPDEWPFPPQLPNAGYLPQKNEILFPAGILQPPVLDLDADDAVIYGSIGAGIAHEMTHGFDDQGRKFDKDGKLNNWWTEEDAAQFQRRARLLVEQYNGFQPFPDLHVDGELTLGENIADFGGLTIAYQAYHMSLNGKTPPPIDGFTADQRFFLAFARFFRGKIRDEALRRKIQEDKHPWNAFRVNGAPFNVPEFYQAFDIQPGDRLYRSVQQRPVIW